MKRSWLYYISPCMVASVICLIGLISGLASIKSSGGWSLIEVYILGPALFILLAADFLVKVLTKGNVKYMWLIEIVLITILIIGFKFYIS